MTRGTALIIPVPEAETAVGAIRLEHNASAALGVPAHITILFPFVPLEQLDDDALGDLIGRFPAFDFTLDRVERFDNGLVWLHPSPSWRFADLTAAVWQRWPDQPPYGGGFDQVVPHLTVSETPLDVEVELPIACHAHEVLLIEQEEPGGRWATRLRFPFG
jgi:2'-5' RNA ligase superfamily